MKIFDELLRLVDALGAAEIPYAICGGIAVAIHGYPRFTKDIDLIVLRTDTERTKAACAGVGFDLDTGIVPFASKDRPFREIYRLAKTEGAEILMLDLLLIDDPANVAWATRTEVEWRGRRVSIVSREGLCAMKRAAGRDIDVIDLRRLGYDT